MEGFKSSSDVDSNSPQDVNISMAKLESQGGTASVNVSGKVNQHFSLSSAAACAEPEVAYLDFIQVALWSFLFLLRRQYVGFASPMQHPQKSESRETKEKMIFKSSPQPPPPPAYSATSRSMSVVSPPALWTPQPAFYTATLRPAASSSTQTVPTTSTQPFQQ